MGRGFLVVEGHGDGDAALNLLTRLWQDLRLAPLPWAQPIRGRALHQEKGVRNACEIVRRKRDAAAILLLRDEDDRCPKQVAPESAGWLRSAGLPLPGAFVLAHREFEAFFLPSLPRMAGRPFVGPGGLKRDGLPAGTHFDGDPEALRGVKEWLTEQMPKGRAYKPTLDQLPLARLVDFELLRRANPPLPCFGSLERALRFLAAEVMRGGRGVYPGNSP